METYKEEILFQKSLDLKVIPFSFNEEELIQKKIKHLREYQKKNKLIHYTLQLLPFVFTIIAFYFTYSFTLNSSIPFLYNFFFFTIIHGFLSYQFVAYTLHQGAGHGIFRSNRILRFISFHSSRLFFADPNYYQKRHSSHHNFLGTQKDGAFSHIVFPKRIIISMLPGAGVFFRNDYKIAQDEKITNSMIISLITGTSLVSIQVYLLKDIWGFGASLISLIILSPWIAMILDRTRESIEHQGLGSHKKYGAKELGLGPLGIIIGGGPWGQPCHFSHHYAPDLHWYQQILLHIFIKNNIQKRSLEQYGIDKKVTSLLKQTFIFYKNNWKKFEEIKTKTKI